MSHFNQGWVYTDRIDRQGRTLLDYYAERYPHSSRQDWLDRIQSGAISINDIPVSDPEMPLQPGQLLSYQRSPWIEPDVSFEIQSLYEDEHLLILSKPSGLPVLPGAGFLENTLWGWLRREYATPPVPIHRLGRGTSGVIVLAKTELARSQLSKDLRDRTFEKRYRALVTGIPAADQFTVTHRIGKVAYPQLGELYVATETGKAAISHCRVLERDRIPNATLLEVTIPTGRPHQIRIHLAAAGYPLWGDPLYGVGGVAINQNSVPGDCGYLLHAYTVGLIHPVSKEKMTIQAEPPTLLSPSYN
ncbi:RluA family pseudouridine synthase [Leptolyngbya boryana CZ1]|uniref:Pseudouridine synthase n=1 Tax=Leptolyngbya boryana CZ1 TaxID=3060204 RepID=A0AA97APB7_LEPBY|nr:RluA family pseudouridine synthase [Leptolyngbya boryana]WNZ44754.1 RluA family pseudouridine synthase [Leptolyngbya boryana CZ1]